MVAEIGDVYFVVPSFFCLDTLPSPTFTTQTESSDQPTNSSHLPGQLDISQSFSRLHLISKTLTGWAYANLIIRSSGGYAQQPLLQFVLTLSSPVIATLT